MCRSSHVLAGSFPDALEFGRGVLISLGLNSVSLLILFGSLASIPGSPIVLPFVLGPALGLFALIYVPAAIAITWWSTKGNPPRVLGAVAFYPILAAALIVQSAYVQMREQRAMESDYSSLTIVQPLGRIALLGLSDRDDYCSTNCRQVLAEGSADEVAIISYDNSRLPDDLPDIDKIDEPYIRARYWLAREGCTEDSGRFVQSIGIFDVCLLSRKVIENVPVGTILALDDGPAKRPYGPKGQFAAFRVETDGMVEIARWEGGHFKHSGTLRRAKGPAFYLHNFVKALAGDSSRDRLGPAQARTFAQAVDAAYASLDSMPAAPTRFIFEYLRNIYVGEHDPSKPDLILSADTIEKLKSIGRRACAVEPGENPGCLDRYEFLIPGLFEETTAGKLRIDRPESAPPANGG